MPTTTAIIAKYFAPPKVTMTELKELKQSMSNAEWDQFGKDTCAAAGVEWEATPSK